jgi:hypothetical protein
LGVVVEKCDERFAKREDATAVCGDWKSDRDRMVCLVDGGVMVRRLADRARSLQAVVLCIKIADRVTPDTYSMTTGQSGFKCTTVIKDCSGRL